MPNLSLPLIDAVCWSVFAGVFLWDAVRRVRGHAPAPQQWVWALATLTILVAQRMRVALPEGLELHYLGAAWLALLVGFPRALLSMAAIVTVQCAWHDAPASSWGLRVLIDGVLPIWAMWTIVTGCRRWLPRNPFVFIFGCGLLGFALVHALQLTTTALVLNALGATRASVVWSEYLPYALLLGWGEAVLEGMLTTVMVVYLPGSVRLFDEAYYLARRPLA